MTGLDAKSFSASKLALADRIRRDARLSGSIRTVGAEICSLANFRTGYTWATEKYLADELGLGHRTVKMAIAALKAAGYIEVRKVGRNNRYVPNFALLEKGQSLPLSDVGKGQCLPLSEADGGKNQHEQGQKTTADRGKKVPPISLENSLGISARAETGAGGGEVAAGPVDYNLGLPGLALRQRLGDDVFKSWLGKVGVVSIDGDELVLQAPSKFIAGHLRANFEASILAAFRVQHPQISRLAITVGATSISSARKRPPDADGRWLIDEGIAIVAERMRMTRETADKTLVRWLERCGRDATGLRRIITEAAAQELIEEQFANLVKVSTKALLFADQRPLPLKLMSVKRRAS